MKLSHSPRPHPLLVLLFLWRLTTALTQGSVQQILGRPTQEEHDKLGAVASENKICSQIGIDLLRGGGNAVDAVVVLKLLSGR